jgi:rSAM/selenodomain-associated transferase 2
MVRNSVAIIIPVLDDTKALRNLLRRIRGWSAQPAQIIVSGAGPEPDLERLCRENGCDCVVSDACRGAQLDDGARAARRDVLWFLHADATPGEASLAAIDAARLRGVEAGYFRFEFTGPRTWQKALVERLVALRTRCGGVPYGDQGLWVCREAYLACGGFAREPLFEEVRLVKRLRGRGRLESLREPIGVAPRRWEREGWWYRSAMNRLLALRHALGVPAKRLASSYYAVSWPRKDRRT